MQNNLEELKRIWYERNPVDDDTGDNKFWETLDMVFKDYYKTMINRYEKVIDHQNVLIDMLKNKKD